MLNKLTESDAKPEDDGAEENSESRMRRALEAMSGPGGRAAGAELAQMPRRTVPQREPFRGGEGQGHGAAHGGAGKPRHRFVRDGEVPVVHMVKPGPREAAAVLPRNDAELARMQAELDSWRQRAEQAERARNELQAQTSAQMKSLHTQLGHVELARADAQALAEARAEEIAGLQAELARLKAAATPRPAPRPQPEPVASAPGMAPVKRGRGRPRKYPLPAPAPTLALEPARAMASAAATAGADEDEPQPVEWWKLPPPPRKRR